MTVRRNSLLSVRDVVVAQFNIATNSSRLAVLTMLFQAVHRTMITVYQWCHQFDECDHCPHLISLINVTGHHRTQLVVLVKQHGWKNAVARSTRLLMLINECFTVLCQDSLRMEEPMGLDLFKSDLVMLHVLASGVRDVLLLLSDANTAAIPAKSQMLLDVCYKLKSIQRTNSPLLHLFEQGSIPLYEFLVQRNELALRYLDVSVELFEQIHHTELSSVNFMMNATKDAKKLLQSMKGYVEAQLMVVEDTGVFFPMSDLLETQIKPLVLSTTTSFDGFFTQFHTTMVQFQKVIKDDNVKVKCDHVIKCILLIMTLSRLQQMSGKRFLMMIGCFSLYSLGLEMEMVMGTE